MYPANLLLAVWEVYLLINGVVMVYVVVYTSLIYAQVYYGICCVATDIHFVVKALRFAALRPALPPASAVMNALLRSVCELCRSFMKLNNSECIHLVHIFFGEDITQSFCVWNG